MGIAGEFGQAFFDTFRTSVSNQAAVNRGDATFLYLTLLSAALVVSLSWVAKGIVREEAGALSVQRHI